MHFFRAGALALAASLAVPGAEAATTYRFSQGGFSEGARILGRFVAMDLDGDGELSSFAGEVSFLEMRFTGNTVLEAFSLNSDDDLFNALYYVLDGSPILGDSLGDSAEGLQIAGGRFGYNAGWLQLLPCDGVRDCGLVFDIDIDAPDDRTLAPVLVQAVPVPLAGLLMLTGLAGLSVAARARG